MSLEFVWHGNKVNLCCAFIVSTTSVKADKQICAFGLLQTAFTELTEGLFEEIDRAV